MPCILLLIQLTYILCTSVALLQRGCKRTGGDWAVLLSFPEIYQAKIPATAPSHHGLLRGSGVGQTLRAGPLGTALRL